MRVVIARRRVERLALMRLSRILNRLAAAPHGEMQLCTRAGSWTPVKVNWVN